MCFPFLFRGTLDTRSLEINHQMKMAAAIALAKLAREEVPLEVSNAYNGREFKFGPDYIVPTPFDPRLLVTVSTAVAKAAIASGAAKHVITDWTQYENELKARVKLQ
jgi:malate dehydrogenase (oxaloacetate-decarboxylating)(NADP+)